MFRYLFYVVATAVLASPAMAADSITDSPDQRLQTLEQRLQRLENSAPANVPASSVNAFNPAISLILSGIYTNLSQDSANYHITGFPLPATAEIGPGQRGFSLAESELGVYTNIDPYFYGGLNYSLHPDNTASVEEAFIQTLALSDGVTIKAGRFFSNIGYLNSQHAHTWDFVDAPLAYQALLVTQYGDDGVQLKWLVPTDTFFEIGAEAMRGAAFPGSDRDKNGVGAATLFAHLGGDVGLGNSWRAGVSMLRTAPQNRESSDIDIGGNSITNKFSGDSRLWIADFVWKYAPNGNPVYTNFKLQAEYLKRDENGDLTYDINGLKTTAPFIANQSGWYVQGVYQFMPYWRVGIRTDRLEHGVVNYSANNSNMPRYSFNPSKNSLMVDYSPSEFSRIRLQFAQDKSRQDVTDNQVFLQYQMSLGAHGAHQF